MCTPILGIGLGGVQHLACDGGELVHHPRRDDGAAQLHLGETLVGSTRQLTPERWIAQPVRDGVAMNLAAVGNDPVRRAVEQQLDSILPARVRFAHSSSLPERADR